MKKYWRYFRVEGDPPEYASNDVVSIALHHGGRFYSNNGLDKVYKGGETLFMDGVDPDKMALTELHTWAYDLGYCNGPIAFWSKIPGSEQGTGFLPIYSDADVVDMIELAPKTRKGALDVFIVCLAERKSLEELEAANSCDVNHLDYFGHVIDDLSLVDVNDGVEKEKETGISNIDVPNNEDLMEQTFGEWGDANSREPDKVDEMKKRKRSKVKRSIVDDDAKVSEPVGDVHSDDSADKDYEPLVDSDYDLNSGDDDEYDIEVETGRVKYFDLDYGEEDDHDDNISVNSSDENSDQLDTADDTESDENKDADGKSKNKRRKKKKKKIRWEQFNKKTDIKTAYLRTGMMFESSEVFKDAVRKHAVLTKKELRFTRNEKFIVAVKCKTSEGCPWYLYASRVNQDNPTLQIKIFKDEHTCCSIKKKVYHCSATFLGKEYKSQFLADSKWSREGFQNAVAKDYEMTIGYQVAYKSRSKAYKMTYGSIEAQYNNLESYARELKKKNSGSSIWIKTELDNDVPRFQRIYICFSALKEGWMAGCRPIIGLDGCHLKSAYKGQLLAAVGIDGNNEMFPVAWAVVEAETYDSWLWFLTFLKEDLEMHQSSKYAIMSDKQKGLELAVRNLFPEAEHRFCVRHMVANFKQDGHICIDLKKKLWAIARATTLVKYHKAMEDMKKANLQAWQWCQERHPKHWSRSHFSTNFKCDILLNNHSESFNHCILEARTKPIIPCLEDLRVSAMVRLVSRRKSAGRWTCNVGPRIQKILKKNAKFSNQYRPLEASKYRFEVEGRGVTCESGIIAQHAVMLDMKSCSCRRWELCGLPCEHAIAAILSNRWSVQGFVSDWYLKDTYMKAYEVILHPIAGYSEWELIDRKIAPPLIRKQPGRPKMQRNKEPGEIPPPLYTRLPKSFYTKVKCGFCKEEGHNVRTCRKRMTEGMEPTRTESTVVHEEPVVQEEPVVRDEPTRTEEPVVQEEPDVRDEPVAPQKPVAAYSRRKNLAGRKKYSNVRDESEAATTEQAHTEVNDPLAGKRVKKLSMKMKSPYVNPSKPKKP